MHVLGLGLNSTDGVYNAVSLNNDLTILFAHHTPVHSVVHKQSRPSVDNDSHTFGISLVAGAEEIVRNVYVCHIRLKQLESEPVWSEDGGHGEIELAICETVVETLGQRHQLHPRQLVGESMNGKHTSCRDIVENLSRMEQGIYVAESWEVEAIVPVGMSGGLGRVRGDRGA